MPNNNEDGGLQFLSAVTHDVVELLPIVGAGRGAGLRLEALQPPPACYGVVVSGPFHELTVFNAVPVAKSSSTLYPQAPTSADVAQSLVGRDYTSITLGKQAKIAVPCTWGAGHGTFLVVLQNAQDTVRFYTSRAKGTETNSVSFSPVWYRTQGGLGLQSIRACGSFCVMRRADSRWVAVVAEAVSCRELGILPCPSGTVLTSRVELLTGEGVRGNGVFVAVGKAGDAVVYSLTSSAFAVQAEVPKAEQPYPFNPSLVAINGVSLRIAAVHETAPDALCIVERSLDSAGATQNTWTVTSPGMLTPKGLVALHSKGTYLLVYVEETETKDGSSAYTLCASVALPSGALHVVSRAPLLDNRWEKHVTVSVVSRAVGGQGRPYRLDEDVVVSIGSELYGIDVSSVKIQKALAERNAANTDPSGSSNKPSAAGGSLAALLAGTSQTRSTTATGTLVRDTLNAIPMSTSAKSSLPAFYAEHAFFGGKPSADDLYKYCASVSDFALESLVTLLYYIADIRAPAASLGEQSAVFFNCVAHLPEAVLGEMVSSPFQVWLKAAQRRVTAFEGAASVPHRLLVPTLGMLLLTYLSSMSKGFVDSALLCTKLFDVLVVVVGKAVGSQPEAFALVSRMESCVRATGQWASQEVGKKLGQISAHCTQESPATKQAMYVPIIPFRVRTQTGTEITSSMVTLAEPPRK